MQTRVRPVTVLSVVAVLLIASAAWVAYRQWRHHPPFPASAVHATATVMFTQWSRFDEDARRIGAGDLGARPAGRPDDRLFVGRLEHRTPPGAGDEDVFHVLVLDERHERVASVGNSVLGPPGYLAGLSSRYSWLPRRAGADDGASWFVAVPANRPGPILFVGGLPDADGLTESDLMVVLVLVGRDGNAFWAERVTG